VFLQGGTSGKKVRGCLRPCLTKLRKMVRPLLPVWSVNGLCSYTRSGICAICSGVRGGGGLGGGSPLSSTDFLRGIELSWIFGGRRPLVSEYFLWGVVLSRWAEGMSPVLSLGVSELMIVGKCITYIGGLPQPPVTQPVRLSRDA